MRKTIQFIILTCVVSWLVAGMAILLGIRDVHGLIYTVFAAAYMLLPAVCAIILQAIHKEKPFSNLNVSFRLNWWFFIAGIVPFIYAFITLGINLLFPDVSFSITYEGLLSVLPAEQAELAEQQLSRFPPIIFLLIQLVQVLIAGYTINAVFAFGEEFGWRGYLLKTLQNKKLLRASLIIGTVWGLWHFPLILIGHNYPQHPVAGVGMMIVWCILLSPVMIYLVLKSRSVITAAIFHGTLNAISGIVILYIVGGNDITNGVTGVAGFVALLLINFSFFLYDKYITKENIFKKTIGEYLK
ncbi:MAG: CPBP family intramembrane metalloprotease [Spirochaetaceae bacterium]|jgi:membrane protease YdiL (CAAX protease family)|nr:CPBP family intramembrane metalloprotease [Spirochaetaceae bacterium]